MQHTRTWLPVLLLTLVSAVSMFYQFNEMPPPYPWADEAGVGYEANLTLSAGPRLVDPSPVGAVHDPHYVVTVVTVFLAAAIFYFTGPSLAALRVVSGLMGIISVGAAYFLAKEMFWEEKGDRARYIGLASAGLMAVSLWLLGVSRIGWAPPAALMLGTIFFYCFWKALYTQRLRDYALAGLFLALAQYGHITARFLPLALGLFLALNLLSSLIRRHVSDSLLCRYWRGWLVMASVTLAGSLPIIQYYLRFPEDFLRRARLISPTFSPELNPGEQVGETLKSLLAKLHVLGLDLAWLTSRDLDVLLSPTLVFLFLGGMGLVLLRLSRRQYQFLLVGWVVMSAPAWLTSSSDVTFLQLYDYARRGILAAPFTFTMAGLFLVEAGFLLQKWIGQFLALPLTATRPGLVGVLGAGLVLLAGWHDYHTYFVKWRSNPYVEQAFSPQFMPLVQELQEIAQPDSLLLFPINHFKDTTQRPDLYAIGFLYQGDAPFATMTNDEATLSQTLMEVTRGHNRIYLVQASDSDDPKQAIRWLLSAHGELQPATQQVPGYQVDVFDLNSTAEDFANLPEPQTLEIPFGPFMQLDSHRYGSNLMAQGFATQQVESGGRLLIDLSWKLLTGGGPDYNAALILRDVSEQIIAQVNSPLVNSAGATSALWQAGSVEHMYLSLPVPVGLAPGEYWLDVALYDVASLRREKPLFGRGDLSYRLGALSVLPVADVTALADGLEPGVRKPVAISPVLELAGISLQTDKPLLTGIPLQGIIYWQALEVIAEDIAADYVLVASDGSVIPLARSVLLGGAGYPTRLWRPSEIVADYLSLRIPPDVPGGVYWFGTRLTSDDGATLAELPLAEVTIQSPERFFELPVDVLPLAWQLGDSIRLVGARLPETVSRGESLPVHLFWQTEQDVQSPYAAFVHVLDETGNLAWQDDSVPGQGQRPVPGWLVGEIVEDYHEVTIAVDARPGFYRVVAGLYDMASGNRLLAQDPGQQVEEDAVVIGQVEIR